MDYFAHPAISNTKLGWFKRSPAHFQYFQKNPQPEKEAWVIGGATHCILFEPEVFKRDFWVLNEDDRPYPKENYLNKENQKWRKEQIAAHSHKKVITLTEHRMVEDMMAVLQDHEFAQELLSECVFEKEIYWIDPITGLECKKKVDAENSKHRVDYKTTDNAEPEKWQRKVWGYDYYRQAGFYDLDIPKPFYFIVQEKEPPYGISVHRCTQDMINYGKDKAYEIMHRIKACQEQNFWPGYESKIFYTKPPEATEEEMKYFDYDIPMWVRQAM